MIRSFTCSLSCHLLYFKTDDLNPDESLNLSSLLTHIRAKVAPKWHQFGMAIGMPEELLQQYSSYTSDERLIRIIDYWFKNHHHPTRKDMAELLCDIELYELAKSIMNKHGIMFNS